MISKVVDGKRTKRSKDKKKQKVGAVSDVRKREGFEVCGMGMSQTTFHKSYINLLKVLCKNFTKVL
ncbi:hypothetical protein AGMMS49593_06030 [Endomicrobiia bacterium]|nr:hypothetical protein AGMMS49593_06030 [Endomicrobiia bacterium]